MQRNMAEKEIAVRNDNKRDGRERERETER